MISKLKKAIARKLKYNFPEFTIYGSNPKQNIKEPCFIIDCINQTNRDLMSIEYNKEVTEVDYQFSISLLIPRNYEKMDSVAPRVLLCLKWLYLDDDTPVFTLNRESQKIDDSSYNFLLTVKYEVIGERVIPPLMEVMDDTIRLSE